MFENHPAIINIVSSLAVFATLVLAGYAWSLYERLRELDVHKQLLEGQCKQLDQEVQLLRREVRSHLDWSGQFRRA